MRVGLSIALGVLVVASASSAADEAVPKPGVGFEVERYDVSITPDAATGRVMGVEQVTIRARQDGVRWLGFSPNALTLSDATVEGRPIRFSSDRDAIAFRLPRPLQRGRRATIRFRFDGRPARGVTATASSMHTSYFACDWMVCLQDPRGDKAELATPLRLPGGWSSLAPGEPVATRSEPDGTVVHRWRTSRPYSPYLFGFAIGKFERHVERNGGVELTYLGEGTTAPELARLFTETPAMVRFLSDKAGLGLPGGRYAQLLVAGNEAQEAATYALIGGKELEPEASEPETAWILVHELAHQWWGNAVTCATWRDFWLNEGIATFMTAAWKEHRFGPAAYEAELDVARKRVARLRETGWDRPLAFGGEYPSLGARRAVQYSKGALFLAHLRGRIGDAAFWKGLRSFTRDHAGGTVTSIDLQRAMERASGRDLSPDFGAWVFE